MKMNIKLLAAVLLPMFACHMHAATVSSRALPAASGVSFDHATELFKAGRFRNALDMFKAIADDQAQSPASRAGALSAIGYIYKCGGEGVVQNLSSALNKFKEALAIENGLTPEQKQYINENIAEITVQLQVQAGSSTPTAQPLDPSSSSLQSTVSSGQQPAASGVSLDRASELMKAKRFMEALDMFKAIADDSSQSPANRAIALGCIGYIYKIGGNVDAALKIYYQALAMPALPAEKRVNILAHIGCIYKTGGNGVDQNLWLAMGKFQEALTVENGLTPEQEQLINKNIAEITAQLQVQAGSSTTAAQPSAVPSSSANKPMLIAPAPGPNKRAVRPASISALVKAKRQRTHAVSSALYNCDTCNQNFATEQRLSWHEGSQEHQDNVRVQAALVLQSLDGTSGSRTLPSASESSE